MGLGLAHGIWVVYSLKGTMDHKGVKNLVGINGLQGRAHLRCGAGRRDAASPLRPAGYGLTPAMTGGLVVRVANSRTPGCQHVVPSALLNAKDGIDLMIADEPSALPSTAQARMDE